MHIKYEWDEAKRQETIDLRGIDFADVQGFDWSTARVTEDTRKTYAEPRFQAFGLIGGRLHMVVFTPRKGAIRIISMRKANKREIRKWDGN